jgi:hypothetical protein
MGYHISILRTVRGKHSEIGLDEVKEVVATNSGWKYENDQDKTFTYISDSKEVVALWHSGGELWTKNPDEDAIACMVVLAGKLNARVRGDENETYRSATDTYIHPDDISSIERQNTESKVRERNSKIRHYLFRVYQVTAISFLGYIAIKWCINNL